jgi:DNA replication ATP-dependent helicase Dna2
MDKRSRRDSPAQPKKKPKAGKLATGKTKYFFQPINTLKAPDVVVAPPPPAVSDRIGGADELDTGVAITTTTPTKTIDYERLVREQQSSDDSFDGIRWGGKSPHKQLLAASNAANASSPLKNVTSPIGGKDSTFASATLINEQVNSMLNKYGTRFNNTSSQTPLLARTHSDVSSESRQKRDHRNFPVLESLPSLKRSKTVGLDVLSRPLMSSLSGWLDKFEVAVPVKKSESVKEAVSVPNTQELVNEIDFEDDFSDSVLDDECEVRNVTTSTTKLETKTLPLDLDDDVYFSDDSAIATVKHEDMSDPFSDDDDVAILSLTTQQKSDKKHADMFRSDIRKMEEFHLTPKPQSATNNAKLSYQRMGFRRFEICGVLRSKYTIKGKTKDQVILSVRAANDEELKVMVRGEYVELEFALGDVIHVVLSGGSSLFSLVDDQTNLMIWNPDILVSATTVSQQMTCPRKTVLVNRFRYPGESSVPLVVGTILHIIFQACLSCEVWSDEFLNETLELELGNHLLEIFSIGNILKDVRSELKAQFPYIKTWFECHFKQALSLRNAIPTNQRNQKCMFSVANVVDVEENIWSPMFGIKGMVDVTLEADVKRELLPPGRYLLPLEIKSGREYISHHAQTSLYALLFKDRYDVDVKSFVLLYTKEKLMKLNDISQSDLKSLVNLRNRLTKFLKEDSIELPDLLRLSVCDRCDVQLSCMTINKMVEGGSDEESGLPAGLYNELTASVGDNPAHKRFYEYWNDLLTKEESMITLLKKDLWVYTAKEREKQGGKGLANLFVVESNEGEESNRFTYTFERLPQSELYGSSLQSSQLAKNDKIIVSDESGHFAIAQGFILSIRPTFVVISSTRRITSSSAKTKSFNVVNHQSFESVLHGASQNASGVTRSFRIDKDDMFHGMGLARYNVLNLFMRGGDSIRREIIVDKKEPSFSSVIKSTSMKDAGFNPDQAKVFEKVLAANEFCLILGMPGTGKTTIIAKIIEHLVASGKSILLASYTHSAVDNILLKVKQLGIKSILRVGHPARVHKDIQTFVAGVGKDLTNYDDFCSTYKEPAVVATTCLGIGDITFNLRERFDYCIIDEASQVSMPISLGPLRFCDKFVLVGDHHQLPPLVQHPSPTVKQGLSQSLFKLLADKYPTSVVELTYQYRMCEEIMLLSNLLVYDGRLKCGNNEVARQALHVPHPANIKRYEDESQAPWMDKILEPANKVLFLNHDNLPAYERIVGEKVENPTEVELIHRIIESLTLCGVAEEQIGVMSLYRAQLRLLNRKLAHRTNVEVLTADQFQGRDKDCIIISLVRSNTENKVGDLLREWRRVNVAITRSKSKLIIVGSESTLKHIPTLEAFMGLIVSRGWMYDLPKEATSAYNFPFEEQASPAKRKLANTKLSDKVIAAHPVIRDIVNEQK